MCTNNCNDTAQCNSVINQGLTANVNTPQAHNAIAPLDLTLPHFHDSTKVNPIRHLRDLDDYLKLRSVPQSCHLAIVFRSLTGPIAVQWIASVAATINNY